MDIAKNRNIHRCINGHVNSPDLTSGNLPDLPENQAERNFFELFSKKINAACYFSAALHYDNGIFDPTISF